MLLDETHFRKLILLEVHIMAKMQKVIISSGNVTNSHEVGPGDQRVRVLYLIILQFKSMTLYNGREIGIRGKESRDSTGKKTVQRHINYLKY